MSEEVSVVAMKAMVVVRKALDADAPRGTDNVRRAGLAVAALHDAGLLASQPVEVTEEMVTAGAKGAADLWSDAEEYGSHEDIARAVLSAALNPKGGE